MSRSDETPETRVVSGIRITPLPDDGRWRGLAYTFREGSHLGTKPDVLRMAERDLVQFIGKYRRSVGSDVLADLDRALEKVRWRIAETPHRP